MMIKQTTWRSYFLAINATVINLVLLSSLLARNLGNRPVADFKFPPAFTANKITARKIKHPLPKQTAKVAKIQSYQAYQLTSDRQTITMQMSYLVGVRGDVTQYLQNYTDIPETVIEQQQIKQQPAIGSYILLADRDRAYLSSCISPRSLGTVTQKQFSQQRYQNDLNFKTAWDWLQGKSSIRDRRCLWVLLTIPLKTSDPQAASQILEAAWKDLYQWWLPNFPVSSPTKDLAISAKV